MAQDITEEILFAPIREQAERLRLRRVSTASICARSR